MNTTCNFIANEKLTNIKYIITPPSVEFIAGSKTTSIV